MKLHLMHHLVVSAVDHLSRARNHLAVVDAQTAFEVAVEQTLRSAWIQLGKTNVQIEELLTKGAESLERRLHCVDAAAKEMAKLAGEPFSAFMGSACETNWRQQLYKLRRKIVHSGLRELDFGTARTAVSAGLKAMDAIFRLRPSFRPTIWWEAAEMDLRNFQPAKSPLTRLLQ